MAFLRFLLRSFSYLFHGVFALFVLCIAVVSLISKGHTLQFYVLPWEGKTLTYGLLGLSLLGIFFVLMAMRGSLRKLFFLWSLVVLVLVVRGFFFSYHSFVPDTSQFATALWIILGAVLAVIGARVQACKTASDS